ncbi:MAG: hypothetical protein Q9219_005501 [cf. Caloplaca sp. 3 TL-2023]
MLYRSPFQPILTLVLYVQSARAFTAYKPNCSEIPEHLNYLSPPLLRGTLSIIWSCFAVVFTCTWAVQHLSVPIPPEPSVSAAVGPEKQPSILARLRHFLGRLNTPEASFLFTKFKWMLLSIAAPEFVLGKALAERWAAQESRRQSAVDGWTTMHAFFANMRGFVLRFPVNTVRTSLIPSKPDELGRDLHRLRQGTISDGDAPYCEQDPKRAELIESIHCHRVCKAGHARPTKQGAATHPPASGLGLQTDVENIILDSSERIGIGGLSPTTIKSRESVPAAASKPHILRRHTIASLTLLTPTTLVNSPDTPSCSSATLAASPSPPSDPALTRHHTPTLSPSILENPVDPTTPTTEKDTLHLPDHPTWTASWALNSMQIAYAQRQGIIPSSPFIPHEALKDRSKGDSFIKGFAILQITALVIQIIARSFQDLATTLLEVNVLAFASCAIVTYILLWHKPQDVKVPTYIDIPTVLTRDQIIKLAARAPVATLVINDFWLHGVSIRAQADNIFPWTPGIRLRLPFFTKNNNNNNHHTILLTPIILGIGGGGIIFGAVHFVAWNFAFPTPLERFLWRLSCTVLVSFPLLGTAFYWIMQQLARKSGAVDKQLNRALRPMCYVISVVYLLARVFLIVEVFRALAYPERSVFEEVGWPTWIPYLD